MKITRLILLAGLICLFGTGCGPSKTEHEAKDRERLSLEEQAQRDAATGNKAITERMEKAFRRRTPEEEAKHQAETARQVQELLKAQKQTEAKATKPEKP